MATIRVHQQPTGSLGQSCAQPNQATPWTSPGEATPPPSSSGDTCNTARRSGHGLTSLKVFTPKQSKRATPQIQSDKAYGARPCRQPAPARLHQGLAQTMSGADMSHDTRSDWLRFQLRIQRKNSIKCLDSVFFIFHHFLISD